MGAALASFSLQPWQWALLMAAGVLVGFAKTGIAGVGILLAPLMASVFEAQFSTGVLLPLLCFADLFAVAAYRRHAEWPHILRLLPWSIAGVLAGVWIGKEMNPAQFRLSIGAIVLAMVALMLWRERRGGSAKETGAPRAHLLQAAFFGLLGGFATMVANAAGPVWAVYLAAMGLPKYAFLGTGAWFFLILNLFKVPFHVWAWGTITRESFLLDLVLFPAIALGAWIGILTARRIPEAAFRLAIQLLAAAAAVHMLIG